MKKIVVLALFLLLVLSGCSSLVIKPVFQTKEREEPVRYQVPYAVFPDNLLFLGLGDSLTVGVGDELKRDGYIGRVKDELLQGEQVDKIDLINTAKRGRRSDQLLTLLSSGSLDDEISEASHIFLSIGGNDVMKIIKRDLFSLQLDAFEEERLNYESRYYHIVDYVRALNPQAPIIALGLYNPFSLITIESQEVESIITDWNTTMERTLFDFESTCYVPVQDLFYTNTNLVYHTDFFHPNGRGYELITNRMIRTMESCGFIEETNGELYVKGT
ncbi:GDSL-type esterase/lipase family protein [Chryseomicrobium sp. FSL W7-1435]|uniref:GDSL-type esterase/lipase family protein n=1 Tax=Chryseomicrobium sp. FSL W7-1435 TaxID=2921704 RepID=UPI00315AAEC2